MKLSPVSFNSNNQARNNKIQNQPRLKPMAFDSVSFGANIPLGVVKKAENNVASYVSTPEGFDKFLSLDDIGRKEVIKTLSRKDREAICTNNELACQAEKQGKVKEMFEIPQNDDEIFKLLDCEFAKETQGIFGNHRTTQSKFKQFLSFQEGLMVLEKLHKIDSKKQFLLDTWTTVAYDTLHPETETLIAELLTPGRHEGESTISQIFWNKSSLEEKRKLYENLLEVIQDDSTTNEDALRIIATCGHCVDPVGIRYLGIFGDYFYSQIKK